MKHSTKLLTIGSAVGVIASVYFSAKNTLSVSHILLDKDISWKEKIIRCAPSYFPTVLSTGATIGCLFLNHKYQMAILQNYILLEQTKHFKKTKLLANRDRSEKSDISTFYEYELGEYFERNMIEVLDAEYQLNKKLVSEGFVSLNDFFEFLGIETEFPDNYGWSQEVICDFFQPPWIDFEHQLTILEDGMECYIIVPSMNPKFIELEG